MGLLPTALKKSSFETTGEFVVGKTSCLRVRELENALENDKALLETAGRIMEVEEEEVMSRGLEQLRSMNGLMDHHTHHSSCVVRESAEHFVGNDC